MVVAVTKPLFFVVLIIIAVMAVTAQAKLQRGDSSASEMSEIGEVGGIAVLSGRIVNVDPHEITINHQGREILVKRATRPRSSVPDFHDYFTEGMYVTVEGVVESVGEVVASRVTRGLYYDMLHYDIQPY